MTDNIYTPSFYSQISQWSINSSKVLVPILIDLVRPSSVIDVGCGDGTWLKEFQINGVTEVLGLDGHYISNDLLKIDPDLFMPCDLIAPPKITRNFDLAICLEVAEHIPEQDSETLVNFLVQLSNFVFFSAAIPYQTGQNHINTQWQQYWADLFQKREFLAITSLRTKIWDEPSIPFFYKQNSILYVRQEIVKNSERLLNEVELSKNIPVSIVHPDYYLSIAETYDRMQKKPDQTFLQSLVFHANRRLKHIKNIVRGNNF